MYASESRALQFAVTNPDLKKQTNAKGVEEHRIVTLMMKTA